MSDLEELFAFQLTALGLTGFQREVQVVPGRRFKFDFYFPEHHLCIEIQGGVWSGGKHGRPVGIARDYEKLNLCTKYGLRLLQFDTKTIKSGEAVGLVEQIIKGDKQCTKK